MLHCNSVVNLNIFKCLVKHIHHIILVLVYLLVVTDFNRVYLNFELFVQLYNMKNSIGNLH